MSGGPLAGVRVLAIAKVWAGPYTAKLLASLGAEVIKVESIGALDEMRAYGGVDIEHAPYFLSQNTEVLSVRVNLKSAAGIGQLKAMIARSDIVLDNLRPGALEKLGLSFDAMQAIRRDIIHVSIKMYGREGPLGYQTGYAPSFAAIGGLTFLTGHEGRVPRGMNIRYGDTSAGAAAAMGAIAALHHREATGEGQRVDLSAVEAISTLVGDRLFAFAQNGEIPVHRGNFHPDFAPHGVFRTAQGGWISIACTSDTEFAALMGELGQPDIAEDAHFANMAARRDHRAELEAALGTLTEAQDADQLGDRLRSAGVPAFPVLSSMDLVTNDLFWSREAFRMVENGNGEVRPVVAAPWKITPDGAEIARGAPTLGEHDDYVYRNVLGLSEAEIAALQASGAIS